MVWLKSLAKEVEEEKEKLSKKAPRYDMSYRSLLENTIIDKNIWQAKIHVTQLHLVRLGLNMLVHCPEMYG